MIQDDEAHAGCRAKILHQFRPVGEAIVRRRAAWLHRENVEMTGLGRDFVPDDRCEIILDVHAPRRFGIVGQNIMVRGDGQFDAFAGERDHPLVHGCIAVMAVGEGVYVGVTGDHSRGGNLAPNPQRQRVGAVGREREVLGSDAIFETARAVERVIAGGKSDAHRPGAGVNHARTVGDGGWMVGSCWLRVA